MSLTYPTDPARPLAQPPETRTPDLTRDEPFVPVYARSGKARGGQGKIRTWMILAPVGVLTLAGIGAMMMMNGGEDTSAPAAEPAQTLPILPATPTVAAMAPLTSASTPPPAPVVREATPAARPAAAPARRTAPRASTPRDTAARVAAPAAVVPSGPQAYAPAPAGTAPPLNAAPAASTSAPAPTPPVIVVEPVD